MRRTIHELVLIGAVGLAACGDEDGPSGDDEANDTAGDSDDGPTTAPGETGTADGGERGADGPADDDADDGATTGTPETDDGGERGEGTDAGETTSDASTDGGGTDTGASDGCAGLDQDHCFASQQLGQCEPVWGVPWIEVDGQWCLFPNGTEYLGCAVADGCMDAESTVCDGDTQAAWNVATTCLPSDVHLAACDPPGQCVY